MTTLIKIFAFTLLAVSAQCNMGNYNNITGTGEVNEEEHNIENFDEVSFSNGWDVEIIRSNQNRLLAKANENLLEELEIVNDNGYLKIGTKSGDNIGKADAKQLTLYYNADLKLIKASSGVKLFAEEQLTFGDVEISSSSGSEVDLNVKTQRLTCNSSSGSTLFLNISSTDVEASSSSGSRLELSGKSTALRADSSSGSSLSLKGYSDSLEVDSSSGSKIDAQEHKALTVIADASSGSSVSVYPMETLDAGASSGGSVKYYNNPSVKITKNESSGGSVSLK